MNNTKSLLATKLTLSCDTPITPPHINPKVYIIRNSDGSVSTIGGSPVMCNGERLVLSEEKFREMFTKAEVGISFKLECKVPKLDIRSLI